MEQQQFQKSSDMKAGQGKCIGNIMNGCQQDVEHKQLVNYKLTMNSSCPVAIHKKQSDQSVEISSDRAKAMCQTVSAS